MWNIARITGSREVAKTKLAGIKDVPPETVQFISSQIDSLPATVQSVIVDAAGSDVGNSSSLTLTRVIQITIRGQHS